MEELQQQIIETQKREKELNERLAKVKVDVEDIDLLSNELDISKQKAERLLRENEGSFRKAVLSLLA